MCLTSGALGELVAQLEAFKKRIAGSGSQMARHAREDEPVRRLASMLNSWSKQLHSFNRDAVQFTQLHSGMAMTLKGHRLSRRLAKSAASGLRRALRGGSTPKASAAGATRNSLACSQIGLIEGWIDALGVSIPLLNSMSGYQSTERFHSAPYAAAGGLDTGPVRCPALSSEAGCACPRVSVRRPRRPWRSTSPTACWRWDARSPFASHEPERGRGEGALPTDQCNMSHPGDR